MKPQILLSAEMIRILPKAALAHKYNCSVQYIRKILNGSSKRDSPRARAIIHDSLEIARILEQSTPSLVSSVSYTPLWCISQTSAII